MGTPEFPDLGKHCSLDECKLIDFLPFTCDSCQLVFCLEHRNYAKHHCRNTNRQDNNVLVCPLCAKGVNIVADEDPNITWEKHANMDCDPSNYEKATKKKKCPVPGCRESLTFSNTIKCRDCTLDHCLKHRFGADHKCPGPIKTQRAFPFTGLRSRTKKPSAASSSSWASAFANAASSVRGKVESSMAKMGCKK